MGVATDPCIRLGLQSALGHNERVCVNVGVHTSVADIGHCGSRDCGRPLHPNLFEPTSDSDLI